MPTSDSHAPARLFQTIAWAVLTVVFVAYAISESSIGALILGALTLVQTHAAFTHAADADGNGQLRLSPAEQR
jgi:hypothetical protein